MSVVLSAPEPRDPEDRVIWTYVIGPFDTDDEARAHARKFRIKDYSIKVVVRP